MLPEGLTEPGAGRARIGSGLQAGEGYLAIYPGDNAESEPVEEGLEAKKQPPPNKIMNGPSVQQSGRLVGRAGAGPPPAP